MRTRRLDGFLNLPAGLLFLWSLVHYGMGGLANGLSLLAYAGPAGWLLFGLVVFLLLFRLDWRTDLLLFAAGWALGYWGEWWGTTRDVWTYWNGAQPPDYLPPLWGLGLLTAWRLAGIMRPLFNRPLPVWAIRLMAASFIVLPPLGVALSAPALAAVDWSDRLDLHFLVGLATGAALVLYRFDVRRAFPLYLCGMLLGGMYETLGTLSGEWRYITAEQPPLWIVPLWGLACVAMTNLADLLRRGLEMGLRVLVGIR